MFSGLTLWHTIFTDNVMNKYTDKKNGSRIKPCGTPQNIRAVVSKVHTFFTPVEIQMLVLKKDSGKSRRTDSASLLKQKALTCIQMINVKRTFLLSISVQS